MIKRRWLTIIVTLVLLITILFFLLKLETSGVMGDILNERYDGRNFFYWSQYHLEIYAFVPPIGFAIYLIFLFFHRLNKQVTSKIPIFNRGLFIILATSLGTCSLLYVTTIAMSDGAFPRHYTSVQIEDLTFHLSAIHVLGESAYMVSECDNFGLVCHIEYIRLRREYIGVPPEETFSDMKLVVDPLSFPPSFELQIDSETVYMIPK